MSHGHESYFDDQRIHFPRCPADLGAHQPATATATCQMGCYVCLAYPTQRGKVPKRRKYVGSKEGLRYAYIYRYINIHSLHIYHELELELLQIVRWNIHLSQGMQPCTLGTYS